MLKNVRDDDDVEVEVDAAEPPEGEVAHDVGHVAAGPVAGGEHAARVPLLDRRVPHVLGHEDPADAHVLVAEEQLIQQTMRAVRGGWRTEEQQVHRHARVHPRGRLHRAGLPAVQLRGPGLTEARRLVEEYVPAGRQPSALCNFHTGFSLITLELFYSYNLIYLQGFF